jgi:Nucleotidyl transferase AbiEii toxin, Type IV TA system
MELDGFTVYVYTPTMIAIEKLRALCQQMDGYPRQKHARVRAKDFYDIHLVLTQEKIDLSSPKCRELIAVVFAAKEVPLHFLGRIESQREFHRPDWPAVQASVFGPLEAYEFYFDFVMGQVKRLQTLWIK